MNNEKKFTKPEADIVTFDHEDVILTSTFPVLDEEIEQYLSRLLNLSLVNISLFKQLKGALICTFLCAFAIC